MLKSLVAKRTMYIFDFNEFIGVSILIFIIFGFKGAFFFVMSSYIAELLIMLRKKLIYKFHFIPFCNAYKMVY